MMNGGGRLSHVDSRERVLKLGESFEKHPRCAFHTVRCEWGRLRGKGALGMGMVAQTSPCCVATNHLSLPENGVPRAIHCPPRSRRGWWKEPALSRCGVNPRQIDLTNRRKGKLWRSTGVTVKTYLTGEWCRGPKESSMVTNAREQKDRATMRGRGKCLEAGGEILSPFFTFSVCWGFLFIVSVFLGRDSEPFQWSIWLLDFLFHSIIKYWLWLSKYWKVCYLIFY